MRSKQLSVLAYANGFTLWHYRATEQELEQEDITSAEFLSNVKNILNVDDLMIVTTGTGIHDEYFVSKDFALTKHETKTKI